MSMKSVSISLLCAALFLAGCKKDGQDKPIADQTPPVIKINGDNPAAAEQGEAYVDAGASATDAVDGSVQVVTSGSVNSAAAGTYTISYSAVDNAGNTATASRTVNVNDSKPPAITLNGEAAITLDYASQYEDDGASAQDTVDGTVAVMAAGTVDTFTAGTYTINYTAADQAGNAASLQRTIIVKPETVRLDVSIFGEAGISLPDGAANLNCKAGGDYCAAAFDKGTTVTLSANPGADYDFSQWQNCDSIDGQNCTVTLDEDKIVLLSTKSKTPPQLYPNVIELNANQIDDIVNFDEASDILIFAANADIANFEIGKILVSKGTQTNEIYFAKRITDIINLTGSPTIIETKPASLDEIVQNGTVSMSEAAPGGELKVSALPGGVSMGKVVSQGSKTIVPLTMINFVAYDKNAVKITLTGTVLLELTPDAEVDFTIADGIKGVRVSVNSKSQADLSVQVSGSLANLLKLGKKQKPLANIKLAAIVAGPAVFIVEVQPYVFLDADLSAGFEPTIEIRETATLGLQWHRDSGWTNLSDYSLGGGFQVEKLLDSIAATASMDIGAGMEAAFNVYGVAGPYISPEFLIGGSMSAKPLDECPITASYYAGANFIVGGKIELLSKRIVAPGRQWSVRRPLGTKNFGCVEDDIPPANVTGILANPASDTEIDLAWQKATDNIAVVSYEVWRRDTNFGRPKFISKTASTSYADAGLKADTQYCYYILAVDGKDNKSEIPLNLTCAVTKPETDDVKPSTPGNLMVMPTSSSAMSLEWQASTDNDAVYGYFITEYAGAAGQPVRAYQTDRLTILATGLNPDSEYCYEITAIDASGNESDPSALVCAMTNAKQNAEWTLYIGCQGREFLLQENFELDATENSRVDVAGVGRDYPGTPLAYVLSGIYSRDSGNLAADIQWTFEGQSNERQDRFTADLSSGNSGIVPMQQIKRTGCDAQIQIIRNDGESAEKPKNLYPAAAELAAFFEG